MLVWLAEGEALLVLHPLFVRGRRRDETFDVLRRSAFDVLRHEAHEVVLREMPRHGRVLLVLGAALGTRKRAGGKYEQC